jgi:hypothetical protein
MYVMPNKNEVNPGYTTRPQREDAQRMSTIAALRELEKVANSALMRRLQKRARRSRFLIQVARLWPVAVGLVLGFFAPQLRNMAAHFEPWGMWLVFPFVEIARRPEIYMGTTFAHMLPVVMLYAQFPIEGLLARIALRHLVTIPGVIRELLFFHFLGAAELWMVSGALGRIIMR